MNNEACRFHDFVGNRIQKIHLGSNPKQWNYISSEENSADHASRGLTVHEMLDSNWFTGPKFVWEKKTYPSRKVTPDLLVGDPEVKVA